MKSTNLVTFLFSKKQQGPVRSVLPSLAMLPASVSSHPVHHTGLLSAVGMLISLNASVASGATTSSFLSEVLSYQVVVSVKRLLVAQSGENYFVISVRSFLVLG